MTPSIPPFPEFTRTIATKLAKADLIAKEGDYEVLSTIEELMEHVKERGKESDFIIRIMIFLEKVYEIRIFIVQGKILLYTDLLERRGEAYSRFDVLIELHAISHVALERYLADYAKEYRGIMEIPSVDDLLVRIRLILRGVEAVRAEEKHAPVKEAREEPVETEIAEAPEGPAVEPYQLSKEELRALVREIALLEGLSAPENAKIGDLVRSAGIVAFGRGGSYAIVKANYKGCKYLVVFAVWDSKELATKYDAKCIRKDDLARNILERSAAGATAVL